MYHSNRLSKPFEILFHLDYVYSPGESFVNDSYFKNGLLFVDTVFQVGSGFECTPITIWLPQFQDGVTETQIKSAKKKIIHSKVDGWKTELQRNPVICQENILEGLLGKDMKSQRDVIKGYILITGLTDNKEAESSDEEADSVKSGQQKNRTGTAKRLRKEGSADKDRKKVRGEEEEGVRRSSRGKGSSNNDHVSKTTGNAELLNVVATEGLTATWKSLFDNSDNAKKKKLIDYAERNKKIYAYTNEDLKDIFENGAKQVVLNPRATKKLLMSLQNLFQKDGEKNLVVQGATQSESREFKGFTGYHKVTAANIQGQNKCTTKIQHGREDGNKEGQVKMDDVAYFDKYLDGFAGVYAKARDDAPQGRC